MELGHSDDSFAKRAAALHALALEAAAAAAEVLRAGADRTVNFLSERDVKLQADRDSEELIRARLAPTGLPVIGEEFGGDASLFPTSDGEIFGADGTAGGNSGTTGDAPLYWVVDPLDGTFNYLRDQPACCVSIALMRGREPLAGVIHDFNTGRVFAGLAGAGATFNGRAVRPRWAASREQAVVMTGFPAAADMSPAAVADYAVRVTRFKKIRMIGSAALAAAYVGVGQADIYYESRANLWDVAAGLAIARAAGGKYLLRATGNAAGNPLQLDVAVAGDVAWDALAGWFD
ncbi:MAG: hypothetical protein LBR07_03025 [Puniceicoccales bacterium]|jgi:myo-inositol-1(or 4)-monophosphatase|nr:hypothetical protein [Puniceicoccales bacterium]